GALLLTALQTLLSGTALPYAFRAIIFGCVVLAAVGDIEEGDFATLRVKEMGNREAYASGSR
ncbi:hypothetical protein ACC687_39395, partial [Rhizobium ruizarguesonis]